MWEIRKHKLYDSDSGPGQQLHSHSSPRDLAVVEGKGRRLVSSVRMVSYGRRKKKFPFTVRTTGRAIPCRFHSVPV